MQDDSHEIKKAVALMYDREKDNAPRIIAAGKGEIAKQIIAVAEENGVPMHKNQSLVEALLKFEVGMGIPPELYRVVAEVLALVFKLDRR